MWGGSAGPWPPVAWFSGSQRAGLCVGGVWRSDWAGRRAGCCATGRARRRRARIDASQLARAPFERRLAIDWRVCKQWQLSGRRWQADSSAASLVLPACVPALFELSMSDCCGCKQRSCKMCVWGGWMQEDPPGLIHASWVHSIPDVSETWKAVSEAVSPVLSSGSRQPLITPRWHGHGRHPRIPFRAINQSIAELIRRAARTAQSLWADNGGLGGVIPHKAEEVRRPLSLARRWR